MAAAGQVVEDQSYVTLATNDTYALGALVLGNSLRRVNTTRRLTVMITSGVTQAIRQQLSSVFDVVKEVSVLDSRDTVNLALLTRPDLGVTFTKLHCWRLTQFSKCVFLDADTLVMQNVDELFEREELSASPDAGWPDCFNSGVFVYTPSEETYSALLQFAVSQGSFDGGDQGLLNMYFSDWSTKDIARHLPFIYNVVSQAFYSYLPAFRHFEKDVKIAHFIGAVKPWHHQYNTSTGTVETSGDAGHHAQFLALWWKIFMTSVHAQLDSSMKRSLLIFEHRLDQMAAAQRPSDPRHLHHHWKPSHQMTSPYIPPTLHKVFYQTTHEHSSTTHVVIDNKDDRQYSFFESFYAEPPMTPTETYPAHNEAYSAKQFDHHWTNYGKEESVEHAITGTDSNDSNSNATNNSDKPSEVVVDTKSETHLGDGKNSSQDESQTEKVGLEGDMAHLNLVGSGRDAHAQASSSQRLDSPSRQYSWEKGQIDYMGVDAFANIQLKLEESINGSRKTDPEREPQSAASPVAAPVPVTTTTTTAAGNNQKPLKSALKKS